ncbi:MAG: DUF421 domain-containing protein [Legionella sp.]|nr:DUF421 domain-containing protein [Legionella sp.]
MLDYDYLSSVYHLDYYARAITVTFYSIFLFRIGDSRLFSQIAAYDLLIFIILGALLGEAIIDEKLFLPSLICCLIITLLHRFLGSLSSLNLLSIRYLKGKKIILYKNQTWLEKNLKACSLQRDDVYQELRYNLGIDDIKKVDKIIMERNGKISFVCKILLKQLTRWVLNHRSLALLRMPFLAISREFNSSQLMVLY